MINVTIGFTLSDRRFHFIPKFYNISRNKFKGFMIHWLTFEFQIDNSVMNWHFKEICYQLGYTALFDS